MTLKLLGAVPMLFLCACSSDGDGGGAGGAGGTAGSGGASSQDDKWWCVCSGGVAVGVDGDGSGAPPTAACTTQCGAAGVSEVKRAQSVKGSAECTAFCAKVDAAGCSKECDEDFWCTVRASSCAAATKARLQCEADNAVVTCIDGGWSTAPTNCSDDESLCTSASESDQ